MKAEYDRKYSNIYKNKAIFRSFELIKHLFFVLINGYALLNVVFIVYFVYFPPSSFVVMFNIWE